MRNFLFLLLLIILASCNNVTPIQTPKTIDPNKINGKIIGTIPILYEGAKMKLPNVVKLAISNVPSFTVPNPRNVTFNKDKKSWVVQVFDEISEENKTIIIDDLSHSVI